MWWQNHFFKNNWWMPGGYIPSELAWLPWILLFVIIEMTLKGFALYRSAKRGQVVWFVALLVINSLGILPAIYLFLHRKKGKK